MTIYWIDYTNILKNSSQQKKTYNSSPLFTLLFLNEYLLPKYQIQLI